MKIFHIYKGLFTFIVSAIGTATCTASAIGAPSENQVKDLVNQSRQSKAACEEFSKKSGALIVKGGQDQPWKWGADSEALLRLIEAYPGTPEAAQKVQRLFYENAVVTYDEFSQLYLCSVMDFHQAASKLISSLSNYPQDKRNGVIKTVLKYARGELSTPGPIVHVLLYGDLVKKIAETKADPGLLSQQANIDEALKFSEKAKEDLQKQAKAIQDQKTSKEQHLKLWHNESRLSEEASKQWLAVIKESHFVPKAM